MGGESEEWVDVMKRRRKRKKNEIFVTIFMGFCFLYVCL